MKHLILILLLLSNAAFSLQSPDIILDANLDHQWTSILVQKTRKFLTNYGFSDPLNSLIDEEIVVSDSEISSLTSPDAKEFMDKLSKTLGVNLLSSRSVIKVKGLKYEVDDLIPDVKVSRNNQKVSILGKYDVKGIRVKIKEVELSFLVKTNSEYIPLLTFKIKNPSITIDPQHLVPFKGDFEIILNKDAVNFKVLSADFKETYEFMQYNQDLIQIDLGVFEIPTITLDWGPKKIEIIPKKVEEFIKNNECEFKALITEQLAKNLRDGGGLTLFKMLEEVKFDREYWIQSDQIFSKLNIGQIASSETEKNIEVNLPADFCTANKFLIFKCVCVANKETSPFESAVQKIQYQYSLMEIKNLFFANQANIVASVSENYINKLLVATYDAGYWDASLKESGVSLGPKKMFVKFDKVGEAATLYLDLVYTPSKFQGFAVGKKQLRFPLVMKVSMRIEDRKGIPQVIFHMNEADLSKETLLSGVKEVDFGFGLQEVPRFRKMVMKEIVKKVSPYVGQDLIIIPFKELSGLGLDKVNFNSDGNGRLNAFAHLQEMAQK
jgi:hypothetical protein